MGSIPDTSPPNGPKASTWTFQTTPNFFLQDDPSTEASAFDPSKHNFGLINRAYDTDTQLPNAGADLTQWQRFEHYLQHLGSNSASSETRYKLIYNGRHGEGFHNVAEAAYGTKAWDDYWSKLDGNGTLYWADAHLSARGEEQAREAAAFFGEQFAWAKMPAPEKYYVSPLWRCLQTAELTFGNDGLKMPEGREFRPVVKEMLREVMGEHTCDRRSSRSALAEAFPGFEIEAGLSEEDELWLKDHRETHGEHDVRTRALLEDVFESDESLFVSFTSHSGSIASLLRVLGHQEFRVPTGGLIPLFVKATRNAEG